MMIVFLLLIDVSIVARTAIEWRAQYLKMQDASLAATDTDTFLDGECVKYGDCRDIYDGIECAYYFIYPEHYNKSPRKGTVFFRQPVFIESMKCFASTDIKNSHFLVENPKTILDSLMVYPSFRQLHTEGVLYLTFFQVAISMISLIYILALSAKKTKQQEDSKEKEH